LLWVTFWRGVGVGGRGGEGTVQSIDN